MCFTHLLPTIYKLLPTFYPPFRNLYTRLFFLHTFYPRLYFLHTFYPRSVVQPTFPGILLGPDGDFLFTFYQRFTHARPSGQNNFTHVLFLHTFYPLCTFTATTGTAGQKPGKIIIFYTLCTFTATTSKAG